MNNQKILLTITGPSLTGKSTLESLLVKSGFKNLISTTTRAMREGEENGKHYYFVSQKEFDEIKNNNGFVESISFDGNSYGMSKKEVENAFASGMPAIIVCEPSGAIQVKEFAEQQGWNTLKVFINNPKDLLIERFLDRFKNDGKATSQRYANRLLNMLTVEQTEWIEPAYSKKVFYNKIFDSFTPSNQNDVVGEIKAMILNLQENYLKKNKNHLKK